MEVADQDKRGPVVRVRGRRVGRQCSHRVPERFVLRQPFPELLVQGHRAAKTGNPCRSVAFVSNDGGERRVVRSPPKSSRTRKLFEKPDAVDPAIPRHPQVAGVTHYPRRLDQGWPSTNLCAAVDVSSRAPLIGRRHPAGAKEHYRRCQHDSNGSFHDRPRFVGPGAKRAKASVNFLFHRAGCFAAR
jgi:hypothetical protein